MDMLVAPGLAPPATLPADLVAAQGIATLRLASGDVPSNVETFLAALPPLSR